MHFYALKLKTRFLSNIALEFTKQKKQVTVFPDVSKCAKECIECNHFFCVNLTIFDSFPGFQRRPKRHLLLALHCKQNYRFHRSTRDRREAGRSIPLSLVHVVLKLQ
jgi:hypothetical protein